MISSTPPAVFLDYPEDRCHVDLPIGRPIQRPTHLPYACSLKRAGRELSALPSRKGCGCPSRVSECRTYATQTGVRSALCVASRELTIIRRFSCFMGDLSEGRWVAPVIDASRDVSALPSSGQNRGFAPSSLVDIDGGVRVCTKATPLPSRPVPREGGRKDR